MDRTFSEWATALRRTLAKLDPEDFDYPIGMNEVREPSPGALGVVPDVLRPLYAVCDGAGMPDVHVGYFVDRADRLASVTRRGEPTRVQGEPSLAIHVFGSDGGGNRFAIDIATGAVYCLTSAGMVRNGVYYPEQSAPANQVAPSLIEFLWRLQADAEAFVQGRAGHPYLT